MCRYAAYGSNLHPIRLQRRVPSASLIGSSSIPGYQLKFHKKSDVDGTGKCNINAGRGVVYLAIFEMAEAEKIALDKIEGLGKGYGQAILQLAGFGDCLTYVADPTVLDEALYPMDWYKEMVLLGCQRNRFPDDYVSYIHQIEPIQDPNPNRARENWRIVDALRDDT
jgi:gamma-glutamylcyclotransferase